MTENVQKADLFVPACAVRQHADKCNALLDAAKRLFRHVFALSVSPAGILAMCLSVGFMGACGELL